MLGRIFSKDFEFLSHSLPDHVSSMAEILEGLDPDDPCFLDSVQEDVEPPSPGAFEEVKREADETGSKNDTKFDESGDVFDRFINAWLFGGPQQELALRVVVVERETVLVMVEKVVDGGAGDRHQRVFEGVEVPEDFWFIGSQYWNGLKDAEGQSPHSQIKNSD